MINPSGFCFFICVTAGLMSHSDGAVFVPILQQEQQVNPDGSYKYSYATANGIMAVEEGRLQRPGTPEEAQAVEGVFTYLNSDGTLVNVRYASDEGGFRPVTNVIFRPSAQLKAGTAQFQDYNALKQALAN